MPASAVLLIRPAAFGFNTETAASNPLQHRPSEAAVAVAEQARAELDTLATLLDHAGVQVLVVDDDPVPPRPDAVFPNNWLSTYHDGTVVLHAMATPNRRAERRPEILRQLGTRFCISTCIDLSDGELYGAFLEGTGSVVLDRRARVAYAARSPRTTTAGLRRYAEAVAYESFSFEADDRGTIPYHTNILLSIDDRFAVLSDHVVTPETRRALLDRLARPVLRLDAQEHTAFAANQLTLAGRAGPVVVLSTGALAALRPESRRFLEAFGSLLPVSIPTIERVGGGSARCMIAEVFIAPRVVL